MSRTGLAFVVVALVLGVAACSSAQVITTNMTITPGWNLIGLPTVPTNPAPATVFSAIGNLNGKLTRLGPTGYITYSTLNPSAFGNILLGEGYWLRNDNAGNVTVSYQAVDVSGDHWLSIPKAGWNLIGYPNLTPTQKALSALFVTNGIETRTMTQAINGVPTGQNIWIGNRLQRVTSTGTKLVGLPGTLGTEKDLYQNYGYWIESKIDNLAVIFPQ